MSGKPSRGWDANSHEDLLLTLLEEMKPSRAVLTSVSERMREKGYSYSFDAIKYRTLFLFQHVQKLRKNRDTNGIQAAGAGSATATPRKKATATPRKRKSAKNTAVEDDDAEDEKMKLKQENDEDADELVSPSPSKRAKRTPKPEPEEEEQPVGEI
ncbi:hypothetical protein CEP54_009097 [Fusarium duplospermum]|uniref:Uncharacterized protein n=1 Tax=Fusarium duplospermum TaxID=1325734 RepID=A0A428PSE8_9HYPO|nr:hypothetical protein CEP54_009097 [Fusarium duplospermum]